jgi:hypothetical protein
MGQGGGALVRAGFGVMLAVLAAGLAAGCDQIRDRVRREIRTERAPAVVFHPPGDLLPGTGVGVEDFTNYAPDIVFPVKDQPAFLNSQVHNPGGGPVGGDQCAPTNFVLPWRDTFCETRSANRDSYNCSSRRIHQGVDIRAGSAALCNQERRKPADQQTAITLVAVADGFISNVGRYSVDLRAGGRVFRYIHVDPRTVKVRVGDRVLRGQEIGYLSNAFAGSPTTMHLHFEIKQNMDGAGFTWVNPYMALVDAYARREGGRAQILPRGS